MDFIRQQIRSSIVNISSASELDRKKAFVVGHFHNDQSENYQTFVKVANLLRDDCHFAASIHK